MIAGEISDLQACCALRPRFRAAKLRATVAAALAARVRSNDVIGLQRLRNLLMAWHHGVAPFLDSRGGLRPVLGELCVEVEKNLVACLCAITPDRGATRPPATDDQRIAIVLALLPSDTERNVHLRQVLSYAAAFASSPAVSAVRIIVSLDPVLQDGPVDFRGARELISRLAGIEPSMQRWQAALHEVEPGPDADKVSFWCPQARDGLYPVQASIEEIVRFAPDFLIPFLGFTGSELVTAALHTRYPVIGIQFNLLHSKDPGYCDLMLVQGAANREAAGNESWRRGQFIPIRPFPKRETLAAAEVRGDHKCVIVTALSAGRLERILALDDHAQLRLVCNFLDRQSGTAAWLMVGTEEVDRFIPAEGPWSEHVASGRLRWLPFQSDLRALYEHCDLYAHVGCSSGGGMGIALAVCEGVPVVVKQDSDAANFLPQASLVQDDEKLFEMLQSLVDRPGQRARLAERQRAQLDRHSDFQMAGRQLRANLMEARRRYIDRARQSNTAPI